MQCFLKTLCPYLTPCQIAKNLSPSAQFLRIPSPLLCMAHTKLWSLERGDLTGWRRPTHCSKYPGTFGAADSSVTPVAPCAWQTQYIMFTGAQRPNRLASAYTLFSVSRCVASQCSMSEQQGLEFHSHCYRQPVQLHKQRCSIAIFHSAVDQAGNPVLYLLRPLYLLQRKSI